MVLCVVVTTPVFIYMWLSGRMADSCAAEGVKCWSVSAALTLMAIALLLVILFYLSIRWFKRNAPDAYMPFTRVALGPRKRNDYLFSGLHLAGQTYHELKDDPAYRIYARFAWLVYRGGWLCIVLSIVSLVPFLLDLT